MKKLRCILVDDEPLSREVLRNYIREVDDLDLLAECRDALEAMKIISQQSVDLLFLDINLPRLSGIRFARSLNNAPFIIFTTAYPEYAVEGFELNAIDYLVKPYSFDRFLKAINRAMERIPASRDKETDSGKILVKADKKLYALAFPDVAYLEGRGDYIRIVLTDMTLLVHDTIKNFMGFLPEDLFMRIHKSYVVNLLRIDFLEGNRVGIMNRHLPVGAVYREALKERFTSM